jgi:hypothetical protein
VATAIREGSGVVTSFSLGFLFRTLLLLLGVMASLLVLVGGWSVIAPLADRGCIRRVVAAAIVAIRL